MRKVLWMLLALVAAAGAGFCAPHFLEGRFDYEAAFAGPHDAVLETEDGSTVTIDKIEELIEPVGELVTTQYYYTDADIYENAKQAFGHDIPFTKDKTVFTYSGHLSVGVQLKDIRYQIDPEQKVITVALPPLEITGNEIDPESFEYPYISESVFNDTNMSHYTELLAALKQQKARGAAGQQRLYGGMSAQYPNRPEELFHRFGPDQGLPDRI